MASVSTNGCSAAQISPEISDDEVFKPNTVWRPLGPRESEAKNQQEALDVVPLDRNEEQKCESSSAQHLQLFGSEICGQNVCSERDEPSWKWNAASAISLHTTTTNTNNNNRPGAGGQFSVLPEREGAEKVRPGPDCVRFEARELLYRRPHVRRLERQQSIVDGLLFEIYDSWHGHRADSFDSDTYTECSSTSEVFHTRWDSSNETATEQRHTGQFHRTFLESQSMCFTISALAIRYMYINCG